MTDSFHLNRAELDRRYKELCKRGVFPHLFGEDIRNFTREQLIATVEIALMFGEKFGND